MSEMDVAFFKPFVDGTLETIRVQCQAKVETGKPCFKDANEKIEHSYDIAGNVGLVSDAFNGSISLCFPEKVFLFLMSNMLGEDCKEITKDLEDGVAELLNIIFGQAKIALNDGPENYNVQLAIPSISVGTNIRTTYITKSKIVILPFDVEGAGSFHIEISTETSR